MLTLKIGLNNARSNLELIEKMIERLRAGETPPANPTAGSFPLTISII
ncbi:MAG: hypothetical protein HPY76_09770 [Anaerolineae bacterium]|nr:hypothetical protein [Anaerolineae bacterium]